MDASKSTRMQLMQLQARRYELVRRLQKETTPLFLEGVYSMYAGVKKQNKIAKYLLKEFQQSMVDVSRWSNDMIATEYMRFKNKVPTLDKLITSILQIEESLQSCNGSISEAQWGRDARDARDSIHQCYLRIARALWKQPFLVFDVNVDKVTVHKNKAHVERIVCDCIHDTFAHYIPLDVDEEAAQEVEEQGLVALGVDDHGDRAESEVNDGNDGESHDEGAVGELGEEREEREAFEALEAYDECDERKECEEPQESRDSFESNEEVDKFDVNILESTIHSAAGSIQSDADTIQSVEDALQSENDTKDSDSDTFQSDEDSEGGSMHGGGIEGIESIAESFSEPREQHREQPHVPEVKEVYIGPQVSRHDAMDAMDATQESQKSDKHDTREQIKVVTINESPSSAKTTPLMLLKKKVKSGLSSEHSSSKSIRNHIRNRGSSFF